MKALWFISTASSDIRLVKSRFFGFDFYVDFDYQNNILRKATIYECKDCSSYKLEFLFSTFNLKFGKFIEAISNYLSPYKCSHYLLETDYCIDLLKKIGNELLEISDFSFISFGGVVNLIEDTFESISSSSRPLIEYLVVEKHGIRIELFTSENRGYEEPHIHVFYDNEKVLKISLKDGLQTLKTYKRVDSKVIKKAKQLISDNIIKARTKWNDFSNKIKFMTDDDGNPTSETYKI